MSGRAGFQAMPPGHHRSVDRWGSPVRVPGQPWTSAVPSMEERSSGLGLPTCLPWYSSRQAVTVWASMLGSATFPAVIRDRHCDEGRAGSLGMLVVHAWKTVRPTKEAGPTGVGRAVVTARHVGGHSSEDRRSHVGSPEGWSLIPRHPKDPLRGRPRWASPFCPCRCPPAPMEPCWERERRADGRRS
jgi:hypothetical protein